MRYHGHSPLGHVLHVYNSEVCLVLGLLPQETVSFLPLSSAFNGQTVLPRFIFTSLIFNHNSFLISKSTVSLAKPSRTT
jgi:hypothetical protein